MKLVSMICPNCGAPIKVNAEMINLKCSYCGTNLFVDNEVQNLQNKKKKETDNQVEKGVQQTQRVISRAPRTSLYGMLLALAMILSYVEAMIPINIGVPGVKLGLPNIVTVIGLYTLGAMPTFIISILRILLVSFMFGNTMTLAYSLSGFALSFITMTILIKIGGFQRTVVSITGGVMHNVGQLLAAVILLHSDALYFYLPVLMVAGVVAGALIGLVSGLIADRIKLYLRQAQTL